ncbi:MULTISPECIES: IS4 family transposase [Exiguobacterium]|uniref:IS4 family transposase n=2 Tax=Bacillales Family XII. Incertae Sedis TaxID=539742 RepID=UPI00047BBF67|nr:MULTISPECIES: IS4 family transposase [Exiguobacterium]
MPVREKFDFLDQLFTFLEPTKINQLAKETGFIQRKRKLDANDFLSLLFGIHGNLVDHSLQELSTKCAVNQEIEISRAALDKKFTKAAVLFLQRLVSELLDTERILSLTRHPLSEDWPFTTLRVLDGTHDAVPDLMLKKVQKTRQTSVKIQHEYDLLTGRATFLRIDLQNVNDTISGAQRIPFLSANELCLQDLGYFHLKSFESIREKESYFLTRFRSDAYLAVVNPSPKYHPNGKKVESSRYLRVDLVALSRAMDPNEIIELEEVYFGRDSHFQARCILFHQDQDQKEKRLLKIERRASRSRTPMRPIVRDLAGTTGYMTNLPDSISPKQLVELYRLRWQIEWEFRTLKSFLGLDHFRLMKQERWLCHVYGTLLIFLLSQLMACQLRNAIWEEEKKEISEAIAIRCFACHFIPKMYEALRQKKTPQAFIPLITRLLTRTARKPNSAMGTAMKRLQFK